MFSIFTIEIHQSWSSLNDIIWAQFWVVFLVETISKTLVAFSCYIIVVQKKFQSRRKVYFEGVGLLLSSVGTHSTVEKRTKKNLMNLMKLVLFIWKVSWDVGANHCFFSFLQSTFFFLFFFRCCSLLAALDSTFKQCLANHPLNTSILSYIFLKKVSAYSLTKRTRVGL